MQIVVSAVIIIIIFVSITHCRYKDYTVSCRHSKTNNTMCVIHSVFRMQENCPWIREWINYHLKIGITHFYLYDNSESSGGWKTSGKPDGSTKEKSKHGHTFYELLDSNDVNQEWKRIKTDYSDVMTVIKWSPEENGKVVYNQPQAMQHYAKNIACNDVNSWTAYIDMDELIVSDEDLISILGTFNDVDKYTMEQKMFKDRLCARRPMHLIKEFVQDIGDFYHKNIVRNVNVKNIAHIHTINVKGKTLKLSKDKLRFNHYTYNNKRHQACMKRWNDVKFSVDDSLSKLKFDHINVSDMFVKENDIDTCHDMSYRKK